MEIFSLIIVALVGCIVGSFLNVVILRYGTGKSWVSGRSLCFTCGKNLTAKELIPLFSYLWQRGKCSECGAKISPQYFFVELATALLFLLVYKTAPGMLMVGPWIIWSLLVIITVYDLRHKIIPDGVVYTFAAVSLVASFFSNGPSGIEFAVPSLLNLLAGPILFAPFFLLWWISKGAWIGFGDAKLAVGIGWFLGLSLGASAIIYGFWLGAIFSAVYLVLEKKASMKTEVPFAPFLILGTLIAWYTKVNVVDAVGLIFPFIG